MNLMRDTDALTGNYSFRSGFFKRMILIVEYRTPAYNPGDFCLHWRDAKANDLLKLELRKYR